MQTETSRKQGRLPLLSDAQRHLLDLSARPKLGTPRWEFDQLRMDLAMDPAARRRFALGSAAEPSPNGETPGASNGLGWMGALEKDGEKIYIVPVVCVNAVVAGNYLWCYSQIYGCKTDREDVPSQLAGFEGPL